jgi:hypothetical protein
MVWLDLNELYFNTALGWLHLCQIYVNIALGLLGFTLALC